MKTIFVLRLRINYFIFCKLNIHKCASKKLAVVECKVECENYYHMPLSSSILIRTIGIKKLKKNCTKNFLINIFGHIWNQNRHL